MGDAPRDEGVTGAQTGSEGQVKIFLDWTKHVFFFLKKCVWTKT